MSIYTRVIVSIDTINFMYILNNPHVYMLVYIDIITCMYIDIIMCACL